MFKSKINVMKKKKAGKIIIFGICVLLPISLSAQYLNKSSPLLTKREEHKLDPRFQEVIYKTFNKPQKVIDSAWLHARGLSKDGVDLYGTIIYTSDVDALRSAGIQINSVLPNFVTARVSRDQLIELAKIDQVEYIDAGEIQYPMNDVAVGSIGADLLHESHINNTSYKGSDVLVCIIDSGIDWEHLDFRDPGDTTQSRILFIWDQLLTPQGGESSPSEEDCDYGVEYTQSQINDEIDGSPAGFVRSQDTYGHGTHVTGTAAGNGASLASRKYGGIAQDADIIVVKAGNSSFSITNVINGLTYAQKKSESLGKPVVVNLSLGSDAGPHDGTGTKAQAIDNFTSSGSGRIVAVSAGNSGSKNIHISGSILNGNTAEITLTVPSYTPRDGSNNDDFDFDLWFDNDGDITAELYSPNGDSTKQDSGGWTTKNTNDGTLYIYNDIDVYNSDRRIVTSAYDEDSTKAPATGTWTVKLINNSGSTVNYHGWLLDAYLGNPTATVTLNSGNSDYTLGNSASSAIIVGSYVDRWRYSDSEGNTWWGGSPDRSDDISAFSSKGPRRDDVEKPDITAPGEKVGSSTSEDMSSGPSSSTILPGEKHRISQGTSMSSPVVTGAVALLLEGNPNLTASQVKDLLTANADTDGYTGSVWNATWGYGKLNIYKSMKKMLDSGASANREIFVYDEWGGTNYGENIPSSQKIAVQFTPSNDGKVTGLFFHVSGTVTITDSIKVEIWSDNGSDRPDTKLGNTVSFDNETLLPNSWNFIQMINAQVYVESDTNYHAVIYHNDSPNQMGVLMEQIDPVDDRSSKYISGSWYAHTYDYRIRPVVSTSEGILVQAKIFLEGSYDVSKDSMNATLNDDGYIPVISPYADSREVLCIPSNIVDWVYIQLRETSDGSAIASKSAFIHQDGRIVSDNGITGQIVFNVSESNYYVVVSHREHLAVMSANTISLSGSTSTLYDFTTGSSQYYGTDGAVELETDVWGMWAGDINQDKQITTMDYTSWYNSAREGELGYKDTDINMDCQVTTMDYTIWYNNARTGASSGVP
jgi:subtilisin family serine protease